LKPYKIIIDCTLYDSQNEVHFSIVDCFRYPTAHREFTYGNSARSHAISQIETSSSLTSLNCEYRPACPENYSELQQLLLYRLALNYARFTLGFGIVTVGTKAYINWPRLGYGNVFRRRIEISFSGNTLPFSQGCQWTLSEFLMLIFFNLIELHGNDSYCSHKFRGI
jgi:hypothetical protein